MACKSKRAEATRRLKSLIAMGVLDQKVLDLWKDHQDTVTLICSKVEKIDDEEWYDTFAEIKNYFERNHPGYVVYHMKEIGGPLLGLFYVGPNEDEWEEERIQEDGTMMCYVYNALVSSLSEAGYVNLI